MASVKRERKDRRVCCENIAGGQESMHCSFVLASRKMALDYSMHEIASTGKKKTVEMLLFGSHTCIFSLSLHV